MDMWHPTTDMRWLLSWWNNQQGREKCLASRCSCLSPLCTLIRFQNTKHVRCLCLAYLPSFLLGCLHWCRVTTLCPLWFFSFYILWGTPWRISAVRTNIKIIYFFHHFNHLSFFSFSPSLDRSACWRAQRKHLKRHCSVELKVSFCPFLPILTHHSENLFYWNVMRLQCRATGC